MTFCANDCTHPGPFVRDGEFMLCRACVGEPAREKRGPERGYEPSGGLLSREAAIAGAATAYGDRLSRAEERDIRIGLQTTHDEKPPGWLVVNVYRKQGNRVLDKHEALQSLKDKPWVSQARLIGMTRTRFVFAHPPNVELKADVDPLAAIEQFRSKP